MHGEHLHVKQMLKCPFHSITSSPKGKHWKDVKTMLFSCLQSAVFSWLWTMGDHIQLPVWVGCPRMVPPQSLLSTETDLCRSGNSNPQCKHKIIMKIMLILWQVHGTEPSQSKSKVIMEREIKPQGIRQIRKATCQML